MHIRTQIIELSGHPFREELKPKVIWDGSLPYEHRPMQEEQVFIGSEAYQVHAVQHHHNAAEFTTETIVQLIRVV